MNTADPLFIEFRREFRAGRYFEAHEFLEGLWIQAGHPPRGMLRGLVQLAVACEHYRRGNGAGARRVFERARGNIEIETSPDEHEDIRNMLNRFARVLVDGLPEPLPRLEWTRSGIERRMS